MSSLISGTLLLASFSEAQERPAVVTKAVPNADDIKADHARALEQHPLPEALKEFVLPEGDEFHLEAATAEVQGSGIRIAVVTREPTVPDDIDCVFVLLGEHANVASVGELLSSVSASPGYPPMFSAVFRVDWAGKRAHTTPDHVSVFDATLSPSLIATPSFGTLGFDGYIAIQLGRGGLGPRKPMSNFLWVRLVHDETGGTREREEN
jgi:hypothetical protein